MPDTHFKLRQEDFRHLIRGGELVCGETHIILADIGYETIGLELAAAQTTSEVLNQNEVGNQRRVRP